MFQSDTCRVFCILLCFGLQVSAHENHYGAVAIEYSSEKSEARVMLRLLYDDAKQCGSMLCGEEKNGFLNLVSITLNGELLSLSDDQIAVDGSDLVVKASVSIPSFDSVSVSANPLFLCSPEYKLFVSVVSGEDARGTVLTCQDKTGAFAFSE